MSGLGLDTNARAHMQSRHWQTLAVQQLQGVSPHTFDGDGSVPEN